MDELILEVDKINEVYLQIRNLTRSSALELKEFLSCLIDNPWFNPRVKAKIWDGRVSFYDWNNQTVPLGLFPQFVKFCKTFNYKYHLNFSREDVINDITDEEFEQFYEVLFKDSSFEPRDYQDEAIKKSLRMKRGIVELPTACHLKGTKILMYDGSLKKVEDIIIGDLIMGDDGSPRTVLKLYDGIDEMYKITPSFSESFIVNKNHILHLECTQKDYKKECVKEKINISVENYLTKSNWFKHIYKLVYNKSKLVFNHKIKNKTKLSPYFIGLYLGDGSTYIIAITTMDNIIYNELIKQLNLYGLDETNIRISTKNNNLASTYNIRGTPNFKHHQNPIFNDFEKLGLFFKEGDKRTKCEDKFIPDFIKYGTVKDRFECLAGLIDTDGYKVKDYGYGVTLKSERLIDDIVFIARSLGFFASKNIKYNKKYDKNYYRCSIFGDVEKIPLRLARKIISGKVRKHTNKHHRGFKVEKTEDGNYYGFELDKNHLYLDENFLIHHNSGKSLVLYSIIRFLMGTFDNEKILLIVPNINLVNQFFTDCIDYGWVHAEDSCALIFNKSKNKDFNKQIIIGTFQSITKKDSKFFEQFGAVLCDEVQTATCMSINTILKKCINADYRIGVTGTVPDSLIAQFTIFGYLGPKIVSLTSSELIDAGVLSKIKIANLILKYSLTRVSSFWHDEEGAIQRVDYNAELAIINNSSARNGIFRYIIKNINPNDNVLILCSRIEHLKTIKKYLEENFKDYDIFEIYGKIDAEDREVTRKLAATQGKTIILGTYATLSTGFNLKRLHQVIFASSYRSKTKILQSIGRGLRIHETKNQVVIWDIVDDLTWTNNFGGREVIHYNHVYKHWMERIKYYDAQGFKHITKNINIEELNI